jgi:hypothetical protein
MNMNAQVRAEYACGHENKIIVSGEVDPRYVARDVAKMTQEAIGEDGFVSFKCHCGRGAAFWETVIDGKVIARIPASYFANNTTAIVTKRPRVK